MAATKKKLTQSSEAAFRGLSKGSTYRLNPEIALELELYGVVGRHGSRRQIIEDSLAEWFRKNPIPSKLRDAALVILEPGE